MTFKKITKISALLVVLSCASSAFAVEIENPDLLPKGFVSGESPDYTFDRAGYAWHAETIHNIISAYGGSLVSAEDLPNGYIKSIEPATGDNDAIITFENGGKAWTARTLNSVLNAYGLHYDVSAGSTDGFATVVAGQEDKPDATILDFSKGGKMWTPNTLNRVLGAYVKKSS